MLQSAKTPSPAIGAGQGGRGTWTQTHGLNLDEGRVWGPKTEPRIWHPKSVPPTSSGLCFCPAQGVPKMGPQNRPLAQPWRAKCPRLTDPHLVAYPCAAAIATATGNHLLADLPTHTRRGTVAFKLVDAGSCVCSQPALPLVAASPCVRERLWGAKRDEAAWHAHMCDLELHAWLPYETTWCCTVFHVGPCLQERWLQTKYSPMLPISG